MVINIARIVDNYVDKLLITFDNIEVELENVSSIFALQYSKLDYCSGSIAAAQTTDQVKTYYNTVLL